MSRTDFTIKQGKTFNKVLRWSTEVPSYAAITSILNSAPVRITAPLHGIPDDWEVCVASVKGMKEINILSNNQPKQSEYRKCKVIDENIVEIPTINSLSFKPYTSDGTLIYKTPVDLSGYIGRLYLKDKIGGTIIYQGTPTFDNVNKLITIEISATITAAFNFNKVVYELEVESSTGVVTQLLFGSMSLEKEVAV